MKRNPALSILILTCWLAGASGCAVPTDPTEPAVRSASFEPGAKEAVFDFYIGDLRDPDQLAKYSRVDILITDPSRFWGRAANEGDIALLKAANPDIKVIAFFRSKCVRDEWAPGSVTNPFLNAMYEASRPYWSATTTGDTLRDWPGVTLFNPTQAAARKAMRDVFVSYQRSSINKFDGVFWDYFNTALWIAPTVAGMTGDPDLDGDGVSHWDDPDELLAYQESQIDSIEEMRAVMGESFIQVANGWRALQDSTFAARLDGMFYELFPNVGFSGNDKYGSALDLNVPNNIFAASHWPRRSNGGPWLILSNKSASTYYLAADGQYNVVDFGDINRAIALLADCTSVHYDLSGLHRTGVPSVWLDLGPALGPTVVDGRRYSREFANGQVVVNLTEPGAPFPVSFEIEQDGEIVQEFSIPTIHP